MVPKVHPTEERFYVAYGRAMAAWSYLEGSLGELFSRLSGMAQPLARDVFYSAKSFSGRADMVRACIPHAKTIPEGREFMTKLVLRSLDYSDVRNRLAHDEHHVEVWTDGESMVTRPVIRRVSTEATLDEDEISRAAANFGAMANLTMTAIQSEMLPKAPELCHALLLQLPRDAADSPLDQHVLAQLLSEISLS
jgi:hypothetical protein